VYARDVEGQLLDFGVSGKLIMNSLVMYDRATESLWSQFLGSAVDGPFTGTKLEVLSSSLISWEAWLARNPDTLVLDQGGQRDDVYDRYYRSGSPGVLGESNFDDRFKRKEFVLGIQTDEGALAFPFRHLNNQPVVNEQVGAMDVVAVFDPDGATGYVFERQVGDTILTFESVQSDTPLMQDAETDTLWDGVTGVAIEGPLAGEELVAVPAFASFWFAWSDFFPDSAVWEPANS
jgi:Protein of unknown function (DUF3179)